MQLISLDLKGFEALLASQYVIGSDHFDYAGISVQRATTHLALPSGASHSVTPEARLVVVSSSGHLGPLGAIPPLLSIHFILFDVIFWIKF